MIDPMIIGISAGAVSALVLRDTFARAVIKNAIRDHQDDLDQFKEDNTYRTSLAGEFRAVAVVMRSTIQKSRQMRDEIIKKMKRVTIPSPKDPLDLPDLEKAMAENTQVFKEIMQDTYIFKFQHLYRDQVRYRLKKAREEAAKRAVHAAMGAAGGAAGTAAADTAAEHADNIYQAISEQGAPHLDVYEQTVVKLFDELGITDLSVDIAQTAHDFMVSHFHEHTINHMDQFFGVVSSIESLPGSFSGTRAVFREFDMLMNDETSMGDAFVNGGVPILIRSTAIKIGMVLDTLTAGASFGAFTFIFAFAGAKASNSLLESENEELRRELQKIKDRIAECYQRALLAINISISSFETEFSDRINACPDINKDPVLEAYIKELVSSYNNGMLEAENQLSQNTREAISKIPENKWYESILFIDRRGAVEKLYLEVQREITSNHLGMVHSFSAAAGTHAEHAIDFMIKHGIFGDQRTAVALKKIEDVTLESAESYSADLSEWESDTIQFREQGSQEVAEVIRVEGDRYKEFVLGQRPIMNSIARRINANNRRQGKTPHPA